MNPRRGKMMQTLRLGGDLPVLRGNEGLAARCGWQIESWATGDVSERIEQDGIAEAAFLP